MDYTRCEGRNWLYSQKTVDLVQQYVLKFPKVFELLNKQGKTDFIFESDLGECSADDGNSEENSKKPLTRITNWLKDLPHNKALRRSVGSASLNRSAIEKLVEALEKNKV